MQMLLKLYVQQYFSLF